MFDIIELNGKKVAELKEIAGKLGITRLDKLKKQDLVYSILDEQAAQPSSKASKAKSKDTRGAESPKLKANPSKTIPRPNPKDVNRRGAEEQNDPGQNQVSADGQRQ